MKKTYLILSIIILILIISSIIVYFYFFKKSRCEFANSGGCDKSCEIDVDCKSSLGYCVNINENVYLHKNVFPAYEEVTCKCENKTCIGIPTGRVFI